MAVAPNVRHVRSIQQSVAIVQAHDILVSLNSPVRPSRRVMDDSGQRTGAEHLVPINRYKTLGVLGGMGPMATVDFLAKIVSLTAAARDQDHLPIIVHSAPEIPDRSSAILSHSDAPLPCLLRALKVLEQAGAEVIAMPCNTAHYWHQELARSSNRQFLHIVDAVAAKLRDKRCRKVGLLARSGTLASGVYSRRLGDAVDEILTPEPSHQEQIDAVIDDVKAGRRWSSAGIDAVETLRVRGAEYVILGCTELPIAFAGTDIQSHCLDATAALAEACIIACGGRLGGTGH